MPGATYLGAYHNFSLASKVSTAVGIANFSLVASISHTMTDSLRSFFTIMESQRGIVVQGLDALPVLPTRFRASFLLLLVHLGGTLMVTRHGS